MRKIVMIMLLLFIFQTNCKKKGNIALNDLQNYNGGEIKINDGCIYQMRRKALLLDASSPVYNDQIVTVLFPGSRADIGNSILKESSITSTLEKTEKYVIQPRFCIMVNPKNLLKTIRLVLLEYSKFYNSKVEKELYMWNGEGSLDLEAKFVIETSEYSLDVYVNTFGKNINGPLKKEYPLEEDETPYIPGLPVKVVFDISI